MGLPASQVILVNTLGAVGAVVTLARWGRWTDRFGSKPMLALTMAGLAGSLLLWIFAARTPWWDLVGVPGISLLLGIFTGGLTVSMSKFELGFIPIQGRAHYVALNVTAVGLGSGLATLAAGQVLHLLHGVDVRAGWFTLDRYRLFFALAAALMAVPFMARMTLPEERARSVRKLMRVGWRRARRLKQHLSQDVEPAE